MKYFFCDTSAIVKRYHEEKGTDYIDRLFEGGDKIVISVLTIIETVSAFKKKKNEGKLSDDELKAF